MLEQAHGRQSAQLAMHSVAAICYTTAVTAVLSCSGGGGTPSACCHAGQHRAAALGRRPGQSPHFVRSQFSPLAGLLHPPSHPQAGQGHGASPARGEAPPRQRQHSCCHRHGTVRQSTAHSCHAISSLSVEQSHVATRHVNGRVAGRAHHRPPPTVSRSTAAENCSLNRSATCCTVLHCSGPAGQSASLPAHSVSAPAAGRPFKLGE